MTARLLGLAFVLATAAGAALADTANVDVTANIRGVCRIESIQSVDFGDLEQGTTAADKTAAGAVNYWCTKGVAYTVTLGPGANPAGAVRQMKGTATTNSAELLKYELISQSPTTGLIGRGPQTPEALALQGTVRGADYNILSVGGFRDTVVITVTP
jgi:spore coat protein U-like protein